MEIETILKEYDGKCKKCSKEFTTKLPFSYSLKKEGIHPRKRKGWVCGNCLRDDISFCNVKLLEIINNPDKIKKLEENNKLCNVYNKNQIFTYAYSKKYNQGRFVANLEIENQDPSIFYLYIQRI